MPTQTSLTQDNVLQGILVILSTVAILSLGDAIIKLFSSDVSLWQIFAVRSLFALPCLVVLAVLARRSLWPRATAWVTLRAALLIIGWIAYYSALPWLEFSTAAVAVYTNPIFTTLITALVLKERVTLIQGLGVCIGFVGVAVVLRPGGTEFTWALLLPLLGALLYSLAMILTRTKCQNEDFVSLAFFLHLAFFLSGVLGLGVLCIVTLDPDIARINPFLLVGWSPMDQTQWAVMVFLGLIGAGFTLGVARAYQIAPPHIVGTFDYGYVGFALVWGFLFFAEIPDLQGVLGMCLVVSAGLMVALGAKPAQ